MDSHINIIKKTINDINENSISSEIIDEFCKAKRVIFCTMGKSAFACRKIVYSARSFGLSWHDLDVCHAFHGDIGIVEDEDLVVLVSKSGETDETVNVARYIKNKKISICSDKNSSLSRLCDYNLEIPLKYGEGSPYGFAPMVSTTMYMIFLHEILCKVIKSNKIGLDKLRKNHPSGKIGKDLETKN